LRLPNIDTTHERWNLKTRTGGKPVSGIYYYVIETEHRNQIGKLVLIMQNR